MAAKNEPNLYVRRIEEIRAYARENGIDLEGLHVSDPVEWILAAADRTGLLRPFVLAVRLPFDLCRPHDVTSDVSE